MSKTGIAFWLSFIAIAIYCHMSLYHRLNPKPFHANWDGKVWSCPANTDTWVDEKEALDGKQNFVYCIPQTAQERQGLDEDQVR